jgi:hypothetical protein
MCIIFTNTCNAEKGVFPDPFFEFSKLPPCFAKNGDVIEFSMTFSNKNPDEESVDGKIYIQLYGATFVEASGFNMITSYDSDGNRLPAINGAQILVAYVPHEIWYETPWTLNAKILVSDSFGHVKIRYRCSMRDKDDPPLLSESPLYVVRFPCHFPDDRYDNLDFRRYLTFVHNIFPDYLRSYSESPYKLPNETCHIFDVPASIGVCEKSYFLLAYYNDGGEIACRSLVIDKDTRDIEPFGSIPKFIFWQAALLRNGYLQSIEELYVNEILRSSLFGTVYTDYLNLILTDYLFEPFSNEVVDTICSILTEDFAEAFIDKVMPLPTPVGLFVTAVSSVISVAHEYYRFHQASEIDQRFNEFREVASGLETRLLWERLYGGWTSVFVDESPALIEIQCLTGPNRPIELLIPRLQEAQEKLRAVGLLAEMAEDELTIFESVYTNLESFLTSQRELTVDVEQNYQSLLDNYFGKKVDISCSTDKSNYKPENQVRISASYQHEIIGPIEAALVRYAVRNSDNTLIINGECNFQGNGQYLAMFEAPNSAGYYTVEVTAVKPGYEDAVGSTTFSVEHKGEVGHDVGVACVYWDETSTIRPYYPYNDVRAEIGESIVVNGVLVHNYGDYTEVVTIVMEILDSAGSPVAGKIDSGLVSVNSYDEALFTDEELVINTTGMTNGIYQLRIKTSLATDNNPDNDSKIWQIIVGTPGPEPGHLPLASYVWYRHQHTGSSNSTTASVGAYTVKATYLDGQHATFDLSRVGWSASGQVLERRIAPYSFDSGNLIIYLDGCGYNAGTGQYLLLFNIGTKTNTFGQSTPFQTVYGYGGNLLSLGVDSKYKAYYDFYLPPAGCTADYAYLRGFNPPLDTSTVRKYIYAWSLSDRNSYGATNYRYGGSLITGPDGGFVSPGTRDDYYVIIPSSVVPANDYNFLIVQHRKLGSSGNGTFEIGYAHSVRMRVLKYRDLTLSSIELPSQMVAGNTYQINVPVTNNGDPTEQNITVFLTISGPCGYSKTLQSTISTIGYHATQNATFSWDTADLSSGTYSFVASATISDDVNLNDNSFEAQGMLKPPPLPPPLQVNVATDKAEYSEGATANLNVSVTSNGSIPIASATIQYAVNNGQEDLLNGTVDEIGGGNYSTNFLTPLIPDEYIIKVTASKVGYQDGTADSTLKVIDTIPPTVPIHIVPMDGEILHDKSPKFNWLDSVDVGTDVNHYVLQVDNNQYFTSLEIDANVSDSWYRTLEVLNDGDYYWRVKAIDRAGNKSDWSLVYLFTIDVELPDVDSRKDRIINFLDLAILGKKWLSICQEPEWCEGVDFNFNGIVDHKDLQKIVNHWLEVSRNIRHGYVFVDGDLSEWSESDWIPFDKVYYGSPNDVNAAKFALKWNEDTNKIYAAVVVNDRDHVFRDDYGTWNASDRIEVYSQGDAEGGSGWTRVYDIAQQYMVGPKTSGGSWAYWGVGEFIGGDAGFEYVITVNGDQIIYEVGVTQFDNYGSFSGGDTIKTQLKVGKIVRFDVVIDTRYSGGFGMLSENTMTGKYNNANSIALYKLK